MCFAISINEEKLEKVTERIAKVSRSSIEINFNHELYRPYHFVSGFSFPDLPVLVENRLELFKWGLIPSWVKDNQTASELRSNTLNAKSETIFEKPSFRKAITNQRCIIPVNGFIEWQTVDKEKIPYFIKPAETEFFLFGGLYDRWINPDTNEVINTFSIITTAANPMMTEIHNSKKRMPFILDSYKIDQWLDVSSSKNVVQSLFSSYDEKLMTAYTISKSVNSSKVNRNTTDILKPVDYSPPTELTLF